MDLNLVSRAVVPREFIREQFLQETRRDGEVVTEVVTHFVDRRGEKDVYVDPLWSRTA